MQVSYKMPTKFKHFTLTFCRALEQYVTQLAEKGPGSLASNMPKVSSPKVLREISEDRELGAHPNHRELVDREASDDDTDTEVDIN